MEVASKDHLIATSFVWQPRPGVFSRAVICKATFELRQGQSPLAQEQESLVISDSPPSGTASLRRWSELAPMKHRTEILFIGHACAVNGRPVTSLVARLVSGGVNKGIEVVGDRSFAPDGSLTAPVSFTTMPLVWERAAGGPGTDNPAGIVTGPNARPDARGVLPVPNLLPAGARITSRNDTPAPAAFAPIAAGWPSRAARLGAHAASWDPARWTEQSMPEGFHPAYFNLAPVDQQCHELTIDQPLMLFNLHPEHPTLSTQMQHIVPQVLIERGRRKEPLPLRLDTLVIDGDREKIKCLWRGNFIVAARSETGRILVQLTERPSRSQEPVLEAISQQGPDLAKLAPSTKPKTKTLTMERVVEAPGPSPRRGSGGRAGTLVGVELPRRPDLPFRKGEPAVPPLYTPPREPAKTDEPPSSERTVLVSVAETEGRAPLPPTTQPPPATQPWPEETTKLDALRPAEPVLPFQPAGAPSEPKPPESARVGLSSLGRSMRLTTQPELSAEPTVVADDPTEETIRQHSGAPIESAVLPSGWNIAAPSPLEAPSPVQEESVLVLHPMDVPPPPLIGPLAGGIAPPPGSAPRAEPSQVPWMGPLAGDSSGASKPVDAERPPEAKEPPATEQAPDAAASRPAPTPEDIPLELHADITAEIVEERAPRGEVLSRHRLEEADWSRLDAHWKKALSDETKKRRTTLRDRHDKAYVAAVERFRGAVTLPEYVSLSVGMERGIAKEVLDELRIQAPALMPIVRLWTRRIATDIRMSTEAIALFAAERAR